MTTYKDKQAYQWHDAYTAALKAWHEEVDRLKQERDEAMSEHGTDQYELKQLDLTISTLQQQLAARDERIRVLESKAQRLVDDCIGDSDAKASLQQALKEAQA